MKVIALLLTMIVFFACNKDNEPSRTEVLCDSPWIYKEITKNGIDIFATTPAPCLFDNTYTYNEDGIVNVNENAIKCDPNNPQVENFPWFFFNNEDSISINGLRVKIIELNKARFVTEFTNSVNDKFLYVMGKQ